MRITPEMQYTKFLDSLRTLRERMAENQSRAGSGLRVEKPSDDPQAAAEAVSLRAQIAALQRYSSNASAASGFLNMTDSALSAVGDQLASARAEALRGASDTTGDAGRKQIATTIDTIRGQILSLARTRYQERYLFSGTDTRTNPYSDAGAYQGNGGTIQVETGDGETLTLNAKGSDVFGTGTGIFGVLDGLSTALRSGDTTAIAAAADSIEAFRQQISDVRTTVGQSMARMDAAVQRNDTTRVSLTGRLSQVENANMAEVITNLTNDQSNEQLLLATGARIGAKSLFDYLG